jgi:diacylglycerol kinase family enzyme
MRVTLVHNPNAGDKTHGREQLVQLLTDSGYDVDYRSSDGDWQASLSSLPDCVAVAGGDGTIAEVAAALAGTGVPIAVLPLGTANNIALALGLTETPIQELIAGLLLASPQPIDLGTARGPWGQTHFVESVGAGLLSDTIADIDHGQSGFVNELDDSDSRVTAAVQVFERIVRTATPVPYQLTLDGHNLAGEYLLVEVMNVAAAGPNLRLARYANASDGLLDVVLIREPDRELLLDELSHKVSDRGRPLTLPIRRARRVTISCQCDLFHVDDTLHRFDSRSRLSVDVGLDGDVVTILMPQGTPNLRAEAQG